MMATIGRASWVAPYATARPSRRMPFSMPACMCKGMSAATTNNSIIETGVHTPVSLFKVVLLCLCTLLLPGLVVLLSLALTGLTGLIRLESPVGLGITKLATTAP